MYKNIFIFQHITPTTIITVYSANSLPGSQRASGSKPPLPALDAVRYGARHTWLSTGRYV